jgi:hypothetical protein
VREGRRWYKVQDNHGQVNCIVITSATGGNWSGTASVINWLQLPKTSEGGQSNGGVGQRVKSRQNTYKSAANHLRTSERSSQRCDCLCHCEDSNRTHKLRHFTKWPACRRSFEFVIQKSVDRISIYPLKHMLIVISGWLTSRIIQSTATH